MDHGATEAVAASLLGLIEPGDEAIVFAPAYDAYLPLIRRAGGIPRGRITEIYGPESSGKTTICLHVIAEVKKMLVDRVV